MNCRRPRLTGRAMALPCAAVARRRRRVAGCTCALLAIARRGGHRRSGRVRALIARPSYPVVIDGIIVAASMVLLDAARHRERAPLLAWSLLGSGIGVTLAANVTYGATSGLAGRAVGSVARARFRRVFRAAHDAGQSISEASPGTPVRHGFVAPPERRRSARRGVLARHAGRWQPVVG